MRASGQPESPFSGLIPAGRRQAGPPRLFMPAIFPPALRHFLLCCVLLAWAAPLMAGDGAREAAGSVLLLKGEAGQLLLSRPILPGLKFRICYTHSVALSPVEDHFSFSDDGRIRLDKTVYSDFGAGLPHMPESGQAMRTENGRIVISGYDRLFTAFDLRVGRVAAHSLAFGHPDGQWEQPVRLDSLAPPGSAIRFEVSPARNKE